MAGRLQREVQVFETLIRGVCVCLCVCVRARAHTHTTGALSQRDPQLRSMCRLAQASHLGKAACALSFLRAWAEVWMAQAMVGQVHSSGTGGWGITVSHH